MRVARPFGVLAIGFTLVATRQASAQTSAPIAVPIVGSPAAQQPPQVTSQPPPTPMPLTVATSPPSPSMGQSGPAATSPNERKLQLSITNGMVTLVAQNVTVREVFAEWQRRSGCQFVNAEKVTGPTITVQFDDKPELDVIDSLLRNNAGANNGAGYGYIVGPRADQAQTGSVCGAVYILASSRGTVSTGYFPNQPAPIAAPLMTPGSPDDEIPPVTSMPIMPPQVQPRPNPGDNAPTAQPPTSFGPIAPTAPGAGRIGGPPTPPPTPNGRGGN